MRTEGVACLAPSLLRWKPLSVTLSKVRNLQSVRLWQVQQLHCTVCLINVGVISSSWYADNNMAEIGERQNVWEEKTNKPSSLAPGQISACLWWSSVIVCVPAMCQTMCCDCVCVHACVSLCVSDLWLEPSLRCLISDRLDWSAQGECDIQLIQLCRKLTQ